MNVAEADSDGLEVAQHRRMGCTRKQLCRSKRRKDIMQPNTLLGFFFKMASVDVI